MTLNLSTLAKHFSDEEAAWLLIEDLRWGKTGPICPHCGVIDEAYFLNPQSGRRTTTTGKISYRRIWKCAVCRKKFSVLVGTVFEDSKIPLSKWLLAIYLMCSAKNGVSALELSRQIDVTPKTAWHLGHRIRLAMTRQPLAGSVAKMAGTVEADETYVGGKKRVRKGESRIDNKTPVFALVNRETGQVHAEVMPTVNRDNIADVIDGKVDKEATVLMTDRSRLYVPVGREFVDHQAVDHGAKEYVRGDAHTNTVEGFFGQLKRSIDGTHHAVSPHHLARYVDEFSYRYNTRGMEDGERLMDTVQASAGKRLMYREPAGLSGRA